MRFRLVLSYGTQPPPFLGSQAQPMVALMQSEQVVKVHCARPVTAKRARRVAQTARPMERSIAQGDRKHK